MCYDDSRAVRTADSSPDTKAAESDYAMTEGGMISESVSGSASFFSAGAGDGLPPKLKSLLSYPSRWT